jgi:HSP20 family protein
MAKQHPRQEQRQQQQQKQGLQRRGESELGGWDESFWGSFYNPFTLMRRMFDDMDRLFGAREQGMSWMPHIDVERDGDYLVVHADLPGLTEKDVQVQVENGVLTISGERKHEKKEERGGAFRSERRYGSFYRQLALPEGVDLEDATAKFKNGVLEVCIKLPQQQTQAKKIEIQSEDKATTSEKSPQPVEGSPELKEIH